MYIQRNCPQCGSRFTYATPTKDKQKIEDNKVQLDTDGNPIMLRARRCRNCGDPFFVEAKPVNARNIMESPIAKAALDYLKNKKDKEKVQ